MLGASPKTQEFCLRQPQYVTTAGRNGACFNFEEKFVAVLQDLPVDPRVRSHTTQKSSLSERDLSRACKQKRGRQTEHVAGIDLRGEANRRCGGIQKVRTANHRHKARKSPASSEQVPCSWRWPHRDGERRWKTARRRDGAIGGAPQANRVPRRLSQKLPLYTSSAGALRPVHRKDLKRTSVCAPKGTWIRRSGAHPSAIPRSLSLQAQRQLIETGTHP